MTTADMDLKLRLQRGRESPPFRLDIKIGGLTREILEQAMAQAKGPRLFLLDNDAVPHLCTERSAYGAAIETVMILTDKVRDLIGKGDSLYYRAEYGVQN